MSTDQDFRATYKHAHDCHIVVVEQYDGRNAKSACWKIQTNLFCASERIGKALADAITSKGFAYEHQPIDSVASWMEVSRENIKRRDETNILRAMHRIT